MATWQYRSNTTINDPSDGNVRANDLDLTLATQLALAHKTEQGGDASAAIAALVIGDTFTMTAKTDAARWVRFDVTALPVASTGWSSIAVVVRASQTPTFTDAEEVTLLPIAPAWGATLLTLAQAKAHLGITLPEGDPGDADLQLKLDQAEAVIRAYLKAKNDPTWTPDTVPPPITAAILFLVAHLDINRGGEDEQQRDEEVWRSIDRILAFHREPTWA